ncbi:hypothetical protein BDK51DRAFT_49142 [Blyttiomyces helicus]|uniref:ABC transmembrane type-1 domain-containing protein n=1 Tax=Blyttiomyces helicus TaxID=388810 RepID=A0A4P9WCD5_9FUNG|nr:hypothetical protein BDK51DRAFT_49142 [Blyttiomyces helicus]|eukprot:RKO88016.1 hypothetical protein BDK51DRAFT_49142 [Blyttiomyces helicus]
MDPFWEGMKVSLKDPAVPKPSLFLLIQKRFFSACDHITLNRPFSSSSSHKRFISFILKALSLACSLTVPIFVQQILNWLQPDPEDQPFIHSGVALAFCLFGLNLGATVFGRTSEQLTRKISINMKTLLVSAMYQKSLRLSPKAAKVWHLHDRVEELPEEDEGGENVGYLEAAGFAVYDEGEDRHDLSRSGAV